MTFRKFMLVMFVLFFLSTLLIPVSFLNKLFFAAIILGMAANTTKDSKIFTIAPIVVTGIFFYGFILSFFNHVDRELTNQFMLTVLVLFLIYPITKYKFDMDYIVKLSGIILTVYSSISFYILIFFPGTPFVGFFETYSAGSFSERSFSDSDSITNVYLIGSTPFLYLPFCLFLLSFLEKRKILDLLGLIIIGSAMVFSSSRGLIATSILTVIVLLYLQFRLVNKFVFLAIFIPIGIVAMSYLLTNTILFSSEEISNRTKILHVESFVDNLNLSNFFTGNGLSSYYYSKGSNALRAHTEITPLDMLRYFGFILGIILYLAIIFPSRNLRAYLQKNGAYLSIFLMYLVFSFTNPIMFNSFGLLIVLWYWAKILNTDEISEKALKLA